MHVKQIEHNIKSNQQQKHKTYNKITKIWRKCSHITHCTCEFCLTSAFCCPSLCLMSVYNSTRHNQRWQTTLPMLPPSKLDET